MIVLELRHILLIMMTYKKQAFSLIELIVTVVIIGVLTALTVPRIQHIQSKAEFNVIKTNGKIMGKALAQLKVIGADLNQDRILESVKLVDLTRVNGVFVQILNNYAGLKS